MNLFLIMISVISMLMIYETVSAVFGELEMRKDGWNGCSNSQLLLNKICAVVWIIIFGWSMILLLAA